MKANCVKLSAESYFEKVLRFSECGPLIATQMARSKTRRITSIISTACIRNAICSYTRLEGGSDQSPVFATPLPDLYKLT